VPLLAEGEFALSREQLETALQKKWIARTDRISTPGADHDLYTWLVDIAAQQCDLAALQRYAPLAEAKASQLQHRLYQAIVQRAWGVAHLLAGEYGQGEAFLQEALMVFEAEGMRWQSGRTLLEWGELAQAQGKTTEARDYYQHALAAFEEMHAEPAAKRTRVVLTALDAS
jgi:tetratricopeptide (TPR) repeat protein